MENTISGYVISIAPRLVMNDVVHSLRREGSRPSRSKGMYLYRIKRVGGGGGGVNQQPSFLAIVGTKCCTKW